VEHVFDLLIEPGLALIFDLSAVSIGVQEFIFQTSVAPACFLFVVSETLVES
jgi:hypothetical protein